MDKIKVREIVVVEGKYDKIKLSSLIDGLILQTDGFQIFKDDEKLSLLRRLARQRGVLILTDSDGAGFVIRNYLSGVLPKSQIKHAYIPDILGKEKRKRAPSREGKLGVEGVSREVLLEVLRRAGVTTGESDADERKISKTDLFEDGFTGGEYSAPRRAKLLQLLHLPQRMTTNAMLAAMNSFLNYEEYRRAVRAVEEAFQNTEEEQ